MWCWTKKHFFLLVLLLYSVWIQDIYIYFCQLCNPTVLPLIWSSSLGTRSRALPSAEKGLEFLGMPGGPRTWGDLGFVARDFAVVAAYGRWRSCTELRAHSFLLTGCWWIWTLAICSGFVWSSAARLPGSVLSGSKAEDLFVEKEKFV